MYKKMAALGLALCSLLSVAVADVAAGSRWDTRQLIIRLQDDGLRRIQALQPRQPLPDLRLPDGRPLTLLRRFDGNGVVVRLPESVSLEEAQRLADQLVADPVVAAAQPDKRLYPALIPSDPRFLPDPSDPVFPLGQWNLFEDTAGIRVTSAWDRTTGSAATVIAVLDTGIVDHIDLDSTRVLAGYDFISDSWTANDGDGRDPDPTDPGDGTADGDCGAGIPGEADSWHGLAVTGVAVAQSDNGIGIAGIDFRARLLPVRVLGRCGGDVSDVVAAIRWAAGLPVAGAPSNPTPADVINLSLSGTGSCSAEEQAAIDDAYNAGALVVVAAGNEGVDVTNISPANCDHVVAVGAIARDGSRAPYSNVGAAVDLSAPGGDGSNSDAGGVLTLWKQGTVTPATSYASIAGTSFAAAQVSAAAALMRAVDPSLPPATLAELLRRTARSFPDASCTTSSCGAGVLDVDYALAGAADPTAILGSRVNSGGGCTLGAAGGRFDPLWLLFALALVGYRARKRRHSSPC
ncbi:MAG TPA: peptidase [Gammaproteobacteria bacterium]|nr:peptidase [Gammaproteobacteria bacterium]